MTRGSELKPSRWDRVSLPSSDKFDPTTQTSLPVGKRLAQRTGFFERAYSERDVETLAAAGQEYTRRVNSFRAYADDVALNISYRSWPGSRSRLPLLSGAGISVVLVLSLALGFALLDMGGAGWLIILPFVLFPTLGTWRGWWVIWKFDRSLSGDKCPDCGYSLAGVPPGLAVQKTGGVNVGPKACPECGAAWPLVPVGL